MLTINVQSLVGDSAITLTDGQKVYDRLHPVLLTGQEVLLDFSGVHILASPFFNAAIGHLLQDFSTEDLNRLLHVGQLVPAGMYALRRVIENSRRYYSSQEMQRAVDEAIREEAEAK